jgi:hypothetical protein
MNWQADGWQPEGWQPPGWQPDDLQPSARPYQARVFVIHAQRRTFVLNQYNPSMTCKSRVFSSCILAGETLPFEFDWTQEFASYWAAGGSFPQFSAIRPVSVTTGLEYVSSGGQAGEEEPTWPTTIGGTVEDGSITWTAQALSNSSLRERISTASWPAVTGFTISDETTTDEPGRQLTTAKINADTAISSRRQIRVELTTTEGNEYVGIIKMKVE